MEIESNQEWFESTEPEVDFNEVNKNQTTRYTNTSTANVETSDIKVGKTFENLRKDDELTQGQNGLTNKKVVKVIDEESTEVDSKNDDHPILKFHKIVKELDLVEKDLEFYKNNEGLFKGSYSLEKAYDELKNLRRLSDFITNTDNYKIIKQIQNSNPELQKEKYNLLNKRIYEALNETIVHKVKIINFLKGNKKSEELLENVDYELYLTPDTAKVRLFTKMIEIKRCLTDLEQKIGNWDIKSKKLSIAEVLNTVKNHLRLFDIEYQKEISTKMTSLNNRLNELNEGKEEFYQIINKAKLDELHKSFVSSKQVEDLIFKTVNKLETLKNGHEEAAYIFVKLKEILDQQEKIELNIEDNLEALELVEGNIKENITGIKKNIDSIRQRFKKLKNK